MIRLIKNHHRKVLLSAPIAFLFTNPNIIPPGNSVYASAVDIAPPIGQATTLTVRFHSDRAINATDGTLHVDPSRLSLGQIDTSGSALNLWSAPPDTNAESGTLAWSGGMIDGPNKGPMNGEILRISVTPLKSGTTKVVTSDATLLATDGKGTNVIDNLGSIRIIPRSPGTASPDIDKDGKIDTRDIANMIDQLANLSPQISDLNGDGKVNLDDLATLFDAYQEFNTQPINNEK